MAIEHTYQEDAERGVTPYAPAQMAPGLPSRDMMVMPLTDPRAAHQAIEAYEQLKTAIVRPDDQVTVKGRTFLKKSFWRRVATCFGLDVHLLQETRVLSETGVLSYSVIYRAVAPNGRSMDGDGYCSSEEFGPTEHNIRAKAHTRAKNRAISDLVGSGEVSADELPDDYDSALSHSDDGRPVTAQQRTAIRNAYQELGRAMPRTINPATYEAAEQLLTQLRAEWRSQRVTAPADTVPADLTELPVGKRGN